MSDELDPLVAEIFLGELDRQIRFATIATGDLYENVKGIGPDEERLWYSIHALLGAAANVSKILWPETKYAARGRALRELLEVPDDSPIAARGIRNDLEHYDDRIEKWAAERARSEHPGTYFDSNIGSLTEDGRICGVSIPHHVMRHFDPDDWSVAFRGDRVALRPLQRALMDLRSRVDDATKNLRAGARRRDANEKDRQ